jgi:hypothetical protein
VDLQRFNEKQAEIEAESNIGFYLKSIEKMIKLEKKQTTSSLRFQKGPSNLMRRKTLASNTSMKLN